MTKLVTGQIVIKRYHPFDRGKCRDPQSNIRQSSVILQRTKSVGNWEFDHGPVSTWSKQIRLEYIFLFFFFPSFGEGTWVGGGPERNGKPVLLGCIM